MSARPPPRLSQRSLDPPLRRLRLWLLGRFGHRFVHAHRVSRVRIGGRSFKRIRFGDAWLAERAARGLEHFAGSGQVPELEARFDEQLLVEFVEGVPLARFDAGVADELARFHARIHAGGTRREPATAVVARAERDLAFLVDAGVLPTPRARELSATLARLAPSLAWFGWDYSDAVPKNFVRGADGRLVAVDVEALRPDALVGTGIAKSFARCDDGFRQAFLAALPDHTSLDLAPDLPFVELCFQLGWLKNRCLKGSRLPLTGLERFGAG